MLDVHFPTSDGRELGFCRYTQPEKDHKMLLGLGLCLSPVTAQNAAAPAAGDGSSPGRSSQRGPGDRSPRGGRSGGAAFQSVPIAKDDAEKKSWTR